MSRIIYGLDKSETGTPFQTSSTEPSATNASGFGVADYRLILTTISDVGELKATVISLQNEVKRIKPVHKSQTRFIDTLTTVGIIAFIIIMVLLVAQCIIFGVFLKQYYPNSITTTIVNWGMGAISLFTIFELFFGFEYIRSAKGECKKLSERITALEEERRGR